jgi:hypothetical protein
MALIRWSHGSGVIGRLDGSAMEFTVVMLVKLDLGVFDGGHGESMRKSCRKIGCAEMATKLVEKGKSMRLEQCD